MKYEYDINKSLSNQQKHGIDFEEAQHLGVSRQAIIKTWLADKLMQNEHRKIAV